MIAAGVAVLIVIAAIGAWYFTSGADRSRRQ